MGGILRLLPVLVTVVAAGTVAAVEARAEPPADAKPALRVEKRGSERPPEPGRPAVVLIPGLGCGGAVWDSTAAALGEHYPVHVVTLAGFDGVPPIEPPRGEKWARAIADLVAREPARARSRDRSARPVLVAHSFGVHVAVRAAALEPAAVGGVVAVDGKPVDPVPADGLTPEQRRAQADASAGVMRLAAGPQWENLLRLYVRPMARDPRDAERVVAMCLRSDRGSMIDATWELAQDVRPLLGRLHDVPLTLVLPIPPAGAGGEAPEAYRERAEREFRKAFVGAAHLRFRYVPDARHCVMYDQPHAFHAVLREELQRMTAQDERFK